MRNKGENVKQTTEKPHSFEQDAFLLVKQALSPSAELRTTGQREGPDAVIKLQGGQEIALDFKLWTHTSHRPPSGSRRVWVLPRATRDIRDRLRSEQESYVDLRGAVFLSFPNLLVDRVNLKLPSRPKATRRSFDPFADRSSLVLRTLLEDHRDRTWGVRELAEAAGVGPATVTRTIRELERYQVVNVRRVRRESEIRLTDGRALFAIWTGAYDWTKNQSVTLQAPVGDPLRFLRRSRGIFESYRWALTLQAGASLVAPHATWERVHVYVDVQSDEDLLEIAKQQEWPVGDEGRLVLMRPYYRDSVWHGAREVQDLPVVTDLQLALDLWQYPLRGREQAEHLISTQHIFG
jgi:hypothetical protein